MDRDSSSFVPQEAENELSSQASGNSNQDFGNDNQTNGNGNWYVSQERDLPDNFSTGENNPFVDNLFENNGNAIGGNIPAFAGDGVPSFSGSNDFSNIAGGNRNQTEGNGNWYFGEDNATNGNGNWEFGNRNQTEGNANWNLGDDNQVTGNGNQPSGDDNQITGNGNQPSGDNNQINGNRVSPEENGQNIVGNGDRYLLMDSEGNIFVVNDESASDSRSEFNFEFLANTNENDSETASLDQPFVRDIFSQFAGGSNLSTEGTEEDASPISFSDDRASGGNVPFNIGNNSDDSSAENQDSDLEEQLRQSPFGRLLDLPGVDGAEDIFGNLGAPSGGEGGLGTSNPFANWNPLTEGNPFTPDDDTPENENLGGNSFAGGENPFAGGSQAGGEPMQSPWDALLQFDEFDSVEDILGISGGGNNLSQEKQGDNETTEATFNNSNSKETPTSNNADAITSDFTETPIANLLDFPGVDSPGDIFSTFGIGDDADSENLLEDWNPYTDGNPFVVGDEEQTEPVYNAEGDSLLLKNQFGYLIQDSQDTLFLSLDDTISDADIEVAQGDFPDDVFSERGISEESSTSNNPFAGDIDTMGSSSSENFSREENSLTF